MSNNQIGVDAFSSTKECISLKDNPHHGALKIESQAILSPEKRRARSRERRSRIAGLSVIESIESALNAILDSLKSLIMEVR